MLSFQFLTLTAAEVWRGITAKLVCQFLFNLVVKKLVKGSLKVCILLVTDFTCYGNFGSRKPKVKG